MIPEKESRFTTIELFAGAGGLALGLENAGLKHNLLVEIDKHAVATLKHNRPEWNILQEDVSKVDFKGLKADVVTGGFPCQSFSHAGKKLGFEDTRGTLFFEFARAIKEIKPKIFVGENVEGLLQHDNGKTLRTMLNILEDLKYSVQYQILNAVNYGVPQKRKRILIIGTKKGIHFNYPEPSNKIVTIKEALKDVPHSPGQKYSPKRIEILNLVPPGGSWVNLPLNLQKEYLGKSFYSGGGKRGVARRLSWDEPCLTLTTSPAQKQTERVHPDETRPLTVREYARIQTFPDSWEFLGGLSSQYKQIGNAVAVKLGEELGKEIIKALERKISKSSQTQRRKTLRASSSLQQIVAV